jgi:SAM-dependent methyltransferase
MLKFDLGCGGRKAVSHNEFPVIGVDCREFEGVDLVADLSLTPWAFKGDVPEYGESEKIPCSGLWKIKDGVVDEVFSSHFLEHLTGEERVGFFNELYRVLKVGGKALIITPDWSHACAYGDPTHKWPPISSWYPLYLNREWREVNAPYVPYTCDFDWMGCPALDDWLNVRNDEMKSFAMHRYTNSLRDLHITLTKRPPQ